MQPSNYRTNMKTMTQKIFLQIAKKQLGFTDHVSLPIIPRSASFISTKFIFGLDIRVR